MKRSAGRFGLTDPEWDDAVAELRAAIMDAARDRRMTWYAEVADQITAVHVEPYSALLNHLLGTICEEEHRADRPLLTAIVTHKNGDKEPGPGFYEMARSLGFSFHEPYIFWSTQVQDVFTAYGRPPRRGSTMQKIP